MNIQNIIQISTSMFKDFVGDYGDIMENPMDFTWSPTTTPGKYLIVFKCMYYTRHIDCIDIDL